MFIFCGHMFNMRKLRSRDINYSGCSTETGREGANVDVGKTKWRLIYMIVNISYINRLYIKININSGLAKELNANGTMRKTYKSVIKLGKCTKIQHKFPENLSTTLKKKKA